MAVVLAARRAGRPTRRRKTAMLVCALCIVPVAVAPVVSRASGSPCWLVGIAAAAHQGFSANLFTLTSDMFPRRAVGSVVGIGGLAGAMGGILMQGARPDQRPDRQLRDDVRHRRLGLPPRRAGHPRARPAARAGPAARGRNRDLDHRRAEGGPMTDAEPRMGRASPRGRPALRRRPRPGPRGPVPLSHLPARGPRRPPARPRHRDGRGPERAPRRSPRPARARSGSAAWTSRARSSSRSTKSPAGASTTGGTIPAAPHSPCDGGIA